MTPTEFSPFAIFILISGIGLGIPIGVTIERYRRRHHAPQIRSIREKYQSHISRPTPSKTSKA